MAVDQLYGMVDDGALRIVPILPEHLAHIRGLAAKYPAMDFCDASVMRLSEIFPRAKVITTDSERFTVYRRFRDRPLALVHPGTP